ncbi:Sodium/glucose cotransporter [Crateriforma conspicua]|uniref:Sodium/glucose cotransporter n=1 Tax=Crateriforma conspicua TaxID=2527996 RepID=A0A5C6G0U1_9PLAN|nr:sodium/solute symporter [Crateriforma conspicua]TWU67100.1 Sodium/glucose cotransporter [Crateriforma conspicua]
MTGIDVVSFVAFFLVVVGISLWKSLREGASRDESDYFLGGRSLSWPIIGISIVAANISSEQMVGMAGSGAAEQGLAVAAWQLMGSVFICLVAITLLPRFLQAGIYTMPEFLEYRYNTLARSIMAIVTVAIYVGVLLTAVLYTGATALEVLLGVPMSTGVWIIGAIGTLYAATGGLKAIAYADLIQGSALLIGGLIVFVLGLSASGGWADFSAANSDKLKLLLFKGHPGYDQLPWYTVFTGMWIVMIYYCGLNQFIVQRNLAAKTLRDGQLGMLFAGALWLLIPFAIVMPGIMAGNLYADELAGKSDAAYPTLIKNLVGPGLRGFIFAAIAGAIISTLASLLNSASTIASIDIFQRLIRPQASDKTVVRLGRILTVTFVVMGCFTAPLLTDGVFTFIQQFQGFIWPGVVAAFLGAFLLPRAPAAAGSVALLLGPVMYAILQILNKEGLFADVLSERVLHLHFLTQVLVCFAIIFATMWIMTFLRPNQTPKTLPVREDIELKTEPIVRVCAAMVVTSVVVMFLIFR